MFFVCWVDAGGRGDLRTSPLNGDTYIYIYMYIYSYIDIQTYRFIGDYIVT